MNNVNPVEHELATSDFYLAAFYLAKKIKLNSIDRTFPERIFFLFSDPEDKKDLTEDFFFGRATIEPKSFVSAIKELKQLMYAATT